MFRTFESTWEDSLEDTCMYYNHESPQGQSQPHRTPGWQSNSNRAISQMEPGMVPLKEVPLIASVANRVVTRGRINSPSKLALPLKSNSVRLNKKAISVGMVPVKSLCSKAKCSKYLRLAMSLGMLELKWFLPSRRDVNCCRLPSSEGMEPAKILSCRSSKRNPRPSGTGTGVGIQPGGGLPSEELGAHGLGRHMPSPLNKPSSVRHIKNKECRRQIDGVNTATRFVQQHLGMAEHAKTDAYL